MEVHGRHTVLVVDDDEKVLASLAELVAREGHEILAAASAERALALCAERLPCLALLDIMMPGTSGLELCCMLQEDPRTRAIPVILISGKIEPEDVAAGETAGAVDYIKKPFDLDEVRLRIRVHLRLHETALDERRLENRLAAIDAATRDAIIMCDPHGKIAHWNLAATSIFGHSAEEAIGQDLHELLAAERFLPGYRAAYPRFQASGEGAAIGRTVELVARHKDGHELPIELSLSSTWLDGGYWAIGIARDISARHAAEERLRRSEARFRNLFESSRDAIMTLAPPAWTFTSGNPAALRIFGARDEAEFTSIGPWVVSPETQPDGTPSGPAAKERIETAMREGVCAFEWTHRRLNGESFPASVLLTRVETGEGAFVQATVRDISAQRREAESRRLLEVELGHARKLEAVGQLAAGIAHEINTPTQYVSDSVHFLKEAFADHGRVLEAYRRALAAARPDAAVRAELNAAEERADLAYLEENVPASIERCLDGLGRISTIVSAMKEFAHPDGREKSPADLNRAIESTLVIAHNEYKYVAEVTTELGPLPPVVCHLGDLNQVFLNLIVNAAHAIAEVVGASGERGRITVRTSLERGAARIEIADTGCGIPPELRDRIFDPFFTTKDVGKGSGQGLAIARSIVVDKHRGALEFESEVGKGTTFRIRLPLAVGTSGAWPREVA